MSRPGSGAAKRGLGRFLPIAFGLIFFILLPPPDRPLPAFLLLGLLLALSRLPCLLEDLHGWSDLEASLPFLVLALVSAARLSLASGAALILFGLEGLGGLILLAALTELLAAGPLSKALAAGRAGGRLALAGLVLLLLEVLAWAWAARAGRAALLIAFQAIAAGLALYAEAGRRH